MKKKPARYYVHWISNGSSNLGVDYRRDKVVGPIVDKASADLIAIHISVVTCKQYRGEVRKKPKSGYSIISLREYLETTRLDLYEDVYSLRILLAQTVKDKLRGATIYRRVVTMEKKARLKERKDRRKR